MEAGAVLDGVSTHAGEGNVVNVVEIPYEALGPKRTHEAALQARGEGGGWRMSREDRLGERNVVNTWDCIRIAKFDRVESLAEYVGCEKQRTPTELRKVLVNLLSEQGWTTEEVVDFIDGLHPHS